MRGKQAPRRGLFYARNQRAPRQATFLHISYSCDGTGTMTATNTDGTSNSRMTGAEIVLRALRDNGVEHIFGYPGAAVLPI
jgi:hypothetical protein